MKGTKRTGDFLMLFAALAVAATEPVQPAAAVALSPAVQNDVQCFILYAMAVDSADKAKNEKTKETAALGMMYYFGKLQVGAPSLNLVDAVRQEAKTMTGNPKTKEIGAGCDTEFTKRGAELINIGGQLQKPAP